MRNSVVTLAMSGLLLLSGCNQRSQPPTVAGDSRSDEAQQTDPSKSIPASGSEIGAVSRETNSNSESAVELDGIILKAPANWTSKPPTSSIIAAEYVLPRADGDDADGRLTLSTAGGTVEANIDRWKGQFDPQPQESKQEEIEVAGLKITIVDYSGDFDDQRGPFAPAVKRPGYRMIAAIVPVEVQLHFIKATGPQNTMAKHAAAVQQFIRSVQPTK